MQAPPPAPIRRRRRWRTYPLKGRYSQGIDRPFGTGRPLDGEVGEFEGFDIDMLLLLAMAKNSDPNKSFLEENHDLAKILQEYIENEVNPSMINQTPMERRKFSHPKVYVPRASFNPVDQLPKRIGKAISKQLAKELKKRDRMDKATKSNLEEGRKGRHKPTKKEREFIEDSSEEEN